ncbi:MAG: TetR/AcrR family transcriptional regulator [Deltaproteobacteria bacterium]|nr:TetR/AcrR family transcriptional regulator [Deltaproteobacteria bacterium]MBW2053332.1 TetR/AcrR family transcriptional regulator [Deltaproteobacteria bacterium]MBW2140100.1 TetR/AcrR family transcriptional regulator [Deltaproteobacteria bacterium]MBW2324478.1 TetR/AcrR family transcriptional regulator [Deltaproteobacteria bacterium]
MDGRKLRAENRRKKIFETLLSFYREGIYCPSIAEMEKRSGVSRRTLHYLFKNAEGVAAEVSKYLKPTYEKLYHFEPSDGPLEHRIETLIRHRARLYEKITPTRKATLYYMSRIQSLAQEQEAANQKLRNHVRDQFKAELAAGPQGLLETLDLLTSWDSWNRLRAVQKLSVKDSIALLCELIAIQLKH